MPLFKDTPVVPAFQQVGVNSQHGADYEEGSSGIDEEEEEGVEGD